MAQYASVAINKPGNWVYGPNGRCITFIMGTLPVAFLLAGRNRAAPYVVPLFPTGPGGSFLIKERWK